MPPRSRRSRSPRSTYSSRRRSLAREPAAVTDPPPEKIAPSPSKFDQLLELIKMQNGLISEQSRALNTQKEELKAELRAQLQTMNKHTTMLQALETNATKDDKAYEGRTLGDAQTWNALDKEALAKIKIMVDEWREVMQISLVFIALFLTVVTAFISPIIQVFTTPSSDDEGSSKKSPLPPASTQLVALFYYLALIVSIANSVLCVLGMQWGARLIATPLGKTNLERALARERRMLQAEDKMRGLMGVLVWTLLVSIGFFVLGFLIQLWELAFSFATAAPLLVIGSVVATGLTLIILGIIIVTTIHAALNDNSPFENPMSNALSPVLRWIRRRVRRSPPEHGQTEDDREGATSDETEDASNADDVAALIRWKKDDPANITALKTYAKLVLNTNDAEVLERAVPSFEIGQWYTARDPLLPVFRAVHERFLATDTSFRVKETVHKQLVYLKDWRGWKSKEGFWRDDLRANEFTRWCRVQCAKLVNSSNGTPRDFFPPLAFFASLEAENKDLWHDPFVSPEECVARSLCAFDLDGELGDREDIFESALWTCRNLLFNGETDHLTVLLSKVNQVSVLRSLIRNPHVPWFLISDLVAFITRGKEVEILDEMSDFFTNLPEMLLIKHSLLVCQFLEAIIPDSPPRFAVSHSLDLSPVLDLVNRNSLFERYSKTLLFHLDQSGLENLSDLHPASRLWEYCRDVRNDSETPAEVVAFYRNHTPCFIPLPQLSSEECAELAHTIHTSIDRITEDTDEDDNTASPVKNLKGPILELLDLEEEQRNAVVARILPYVQRSHFVTLLMEKCYLPWSRLQDLVSFIAQDYELEILTAVSGFDSSGIPNHTVTTFLDFLGCLLLSLPNNFTVPPSFDLSRVIFHLVHCERKRQTWSKYTDIIITYLDHGAFDKLDRDYLDDVAYFLILCTTGSQKMRQWEDEERPSEQTRRRAMFYIGELKTRIARDPDLAWVTVRLPEISDQAPLALTEEPPLSPQKEAWTSRVRKWGNALWKPPRNTPVLDSGPDIELGPTGGLGVDQDET
ncbi:hypothetical protein SISSUDRAFT_1066351 [Sistotremastrum suecicum HHB10207 ss-3]|uniref:DUF6535 domain-containing protein n=1 Tax=Sistotremastrum suecicum HHB10207 ss-3 TaxID=1314776 RepID=A0A165YEJ7_9AGAM|nr:hypothetical protein SISSUDRAFT_1066351 [Sistotremastrum suecicum HHB10207 ss-3]